jgi:hypothetical protein
MDPVMAIAASSDHDSCGSVEVVVAVLLRSQPLPPRIGGPQVVVVNEVLAKKACVVLMFLGLPSSPSSGTWHPERKKATRTAGKMKSMVRQEYTLVISSRKLVLHKEYDDVS